MKKNGECNHCGWCCQFEGIHRNVVLPQDGSTTIDVTDQEFYKLRGGRADPDGRFVLYVMQAYVPCSAHNTTNMNCGIYENRPTICKEFPSKPEQIEGTPCSYWFEEIIDGKSIKRGGHGSPYPTPPVFMIRDV